MSHRCAELVFKKMTCTCRNQAAFLIRTSARQQTQGINLGLHQHRLAPSQYPWVILILKWEYRVYTRAGFFYLTPFSISSVLSVMLLIVLIWSLGRKDKVMSPEDWCLSPKEKRLFKESLVSSSNIRGNIGHTPHLLLPMEAFFLVWQPMSYSKFKSTL